jgi:hypothetical protein
MAQLTKQRRRIMPTQTNGKFGNRNGTTFIVVMCLTLLGVLAASSVVSTVGSRVRQASKQVDLEQAFYVAAAGAERAASYVADDHETTTTLTGTLGDGSYSAAINCVSASGGGVEIDVISTGTVNGSLSHGYAPRPAACELGPLCPVVQLGSHDALDASRRSFQGAGFFCSTVPFPRQRSGDQGTNTFL